MKSDRCSVRARVRGDALAGSASHVRAWLLIEDPGPWGESALIDARLPDGIGPEVLRRCTAAGVRPLLIRKPGRAQPGAPRRVFAAYSRGQRTHVLTRTLNTPAELLDIDLTDLAGLAEQGWAPHREPIFGVCTHGRHDACCAERGRPVAAALHAVEPDSTWEVSHIGGDRYAANLLAILPGRYLGALYFGQVTQSAVASLAAALKNGQLPIAHFRGRSAWAMPVQAAEVAVRERRAIAGLDAVRLTSARAVDGATEVTFALHDQGTSNAADSAPEAVTVFVDRVVTGTARLTCTARVENPLVRFETRFQPE